MDVGVGLPSTIPDATGSQVVEWARRADELGFSTLGVLDRLVYGNYDPLVALAAAAAVTKRIKLATTILIAPYRADVAVLAKQVASIDKLSGGRLVLGMSAGGREDDFEATGTEFGRRGRALDAMVERMRAIWAGEHDGLDRPIGPTPQSGPRLAFGGHSKYAVRRAGRWGWGWVASGSSPAGLDRLLEFARETWAEQGVTTEPRKLAIHYYALGDDAEAHAGRFLQDYYSYLGPQFAGKIAGGALKTEAEVAGTIERYAAAGCDELILIPCNPDPEQVDLLAKVRGAA
ncbi:Flavin-dependent oxidoreductase, luciferase family (includes alkanesulfonate monooxygenase SsuD and methylene tetrahydromethanopterin reductase) [Micromonospora pallida]|uniref:Flavin-dependent oxidoreductase, luciferase family (Includes alkanesulfonate monooxygenase SsuD and methylene tetrahydromethanopterin reductase) n=1 Tax=Micromonospora pallida TaxID=145854 RepID=A0A1C6SB01_9ACTN|nr:LLM class flavin-dependent oxidoreductase [Micromonospora pallida]SCL26650.1 Flavin-dependent oxidoreductase, luciferase family (includes alkanesulfonate monooxygenase SsuD and methylene tetrahydromethanopterin reductase) [Micromonospora pallida]